MKKILIVSFFVSSVILTSLVQFLNVPVYAVEETEEEIADESWIDESRSKIEEKEYEPSLQETDSQGNGFETPKWHFANRENNLRAYFDENGWAMIARELSEDDEEWNFNYEFKGIGRADVSAPPTETPESVEMTERAIVSMSDNVVYLKRNNIDEWYKNSKEGIEQGFTINEKPEGEGELILHGQINTNLSINAKSDEEITFSTTKKDIFTYGNLKAYDSNGKELSARMEIEGDEENGYLLQLIVDDSDAVYPITIDPLSSSPDWTEEIDQAGASLGRRVSTAGDVNGDGYSDVIVGANSYDNGQSNEGAVFVYYGSSSGLSALPDWTIEGNSVDEYLGLASTAGDVNGDEYSDIIVGDSSYSNGQEYEGIAYVYYGSGAGLSNTPDWTYESNSVWAFYAGSVSTAGDVNGDSYSDIIVGSSYYSNGQEYEGAAFVYFGSSTGPSLTPDWTQESNQSLSYYGNSVSTAGDVNGDGYGDIIVSASSYDNGQADEGAAFVYFGSATGPSVSADWTGEINQASASYGSSVSTAGDVNGDGYGDIIVGATEYDNGQSNEGGAFLYYGSSEGPSAVADWSTESNQAGANTGRSATTAGDINGDGYGDIIVGCEDYANGQVSEGRASVFYGSATGPSLTADWTAESNQVDGEFSQYVSSAGDVDGDGFSDIIIGDPAYDNGQADEGRAFVYYGSADGPSASADWTEESDQAGAAFGYIVSTAGDVNRDSYSDVIVGAYSYDNGEANEGMAFVYYGSATGLSATPDWTAEGNQADAYYANVVSSAGDVNRDSYSDIIVAAGYYDNGEANEGMVFVYYGSAAGLSATPDWTAEGNQADATFGSIVTTAGDVNGDSFSDVIIGASTYDNGEADEGAAFVYFGSTAGLSTTPDWTGESNQANAYYAQSASTVGDINGDGYSDIMLGAGFYDNEQADEGMVFVYYGSATGPSAAADWTYESDQIEAWLGYGIFLPAGDVNGDGYSDLLFGSPTYDNGQADEGKVFLFYGSAAGPADVPDWTEELNQASAWFGWNSAGAGDVNGDGYSDIIIGADSYDNGQSNEGGAFLYYGSAAGPSASADWTGESNQASAYYGTSVSSAGDVNGDSFDDILVGAYNYDNGQNNEGRAFLYYGNAGGLTVLPKQTEIGTTSVILKNGLSDSVNSFKIKLNSRTPMGRTKAKMWYEVKAFGTDFDGDDLESSAAWTDTGLTGNTITETVDLLTDSTQYHWRARLQYFPSMNFSPWYSGNNSNGWNESDLRTAFPPTVTLSIASGSVVEYGGTASVIAALSRVSVDTVTVNLSYSGTGVRSTDYTSDASITIAAGNLTGSITLTGVNDIANEGTETAIIDISTVTNADESGTQQQTINIVDDDSFDNNTGGGSSGSSSSPSSSDSNDDASDSSDTTDTSDTSQETYTLPSDTSSTEPITVDNFSSIDLPDTGTFTQETVFNDPEVENLSITFDQNTSVITSDGEIYSGEISLPSETSSYSDDPDLTILAVYDVDEDQKDLIFDQDVLFTLPIPSRRTNETPKVYYFNEDSNDYELAGDGGTLSDDGKYISFEFDRLATFAIAYSYLSTGDSIFSDILDHWAIAFIEELYELSIIGGYEDGTFRPNNPITRAELTKIALTAYGITVEETVFEQPFSDVEKDLWYAPYIEKAKELNIIEGYDDGLFKPNDPIQRVEALKILLEASGLIIEGGEMDFPDTDAGTWYEKYVAYAALQGFVSGYEDGTFGPANNILRGEE